ncbi:hypothetical protein RFI_37935 [Reticulomyxa filosa]|uniref:Uncharacterized protein n=1 Tax=Reticulomyxa filosa TaxID=46433 RepID=X6LFL8_RETFI|nr:hypothetical protein RFI_37935 [Reticulomyxa filosa]|eukprot:ETN99534.1 hypothetical protein RFI_37935 [Reticulomyxa filosa]
MKASLVLIAVHVLNAFLMISNATNVNIFNSSKDVANEQISQQYVHIGNAIEYISKLLYQQRVDIENVEMCVMFTNLQFGNLVSCANFNKWSMVLENESIRFPSSKLLINTKLFKNISYIKMQAMNIFQSTLVISSTFFKLAFKSLSHSERIDCIYDGIDLKKNLKKTKIVLYWQLANLNIGLELSFDNSLHNVGSNTKFNYQHQLQIYFSGVSMFNVNDIPFQMIENSDIKSKIMSLISTIRLQFYNAVQFCNVKFSSFFLKKNKQINKKIG